MDKCVVEKNAILLLITHGYTKVAYDMLATHLEEWVKADYAYKGVELCQRIQEEQCFPPEVKALESRFQTLRFFG
jgi:hypothetical protein